MRKYLNLRPIIAFGLIFAFVVNTFGPLPRAQADEFHLPTPGAMVHLSPEYNPPILKGIKVHPDNPFRFDFILDKGDGELSNNQLKVESTKLIKYFLASLTIPEKDLWVNLSPYEKNRIIPQSFGLTEMGRDLLAEDYMLKQITASLIYPEGETGKRFWKRIYEEAYKKFGTTNIPVNTFNKVWIVPEKAIVYENAKAGTAYVVESKLKVMLEQDYLSMSKHASIPDDTASLGAKIVREIVIPELTKEVNEDKNFVKLRQIYNSLILAAWYKKKIKDSILSQVYSDKNKIAGVNIDDRQEIGRIYQRYLQAFKKGVYNYIKEDINPVTLETMPRKYFSGGFDAALIAPLIGYAKESQLPAQLDNAQIVSADFKPLSGPDAAMLSKLRTKLTASNIILKIMPGFDHMVTPGVSVNIGGSSFLPSEYLADIKKILSWCRPEDLEGLRINIIPFWHPAISFLMTPNELGFQHNRGIVMGIFFKRQTFQQVFIHELTHWLLRNKPYLEFSLAQGKIDPGGWPREGVYFPSQYASKNIKEYAAELAVYAAFHKDNNAIIGSQQRKTIVSRIFNTDDNNFHLSETSEYALDTGLVVVLVGLAHLLAGTAAIHSSYFNDVVIYSALMLYAAKWANTKGNFNKGGFLSPGYYIGKKSKAPAYLMTFMLAFVVLNHSFSLSRFWSEPYSMVERQQVKILKDEHEKYTVQLVNIKGQKKKDDINSFVNVEPQYLGDVPRIHSIPDHGAGFLNVIATIYEYYGKKWSPEQITQTWGDADEVEVPKENLGAPIMYKKRIDDGSWRDGFRIKLIERREQTAKQIEDALKQGHPLISYNVYLSYPSEEAAIAANDDSDSPHLIIGIEQASKEFMRSLLTDGVQKGYIQQFELDEMRKDGAPLAGYIEIYIVPGFSPLVKKRFIKENSDGSPVENYDYLEFIPTDHAMISNQTFSLIRFNIFDRLMKAIDLQGGPITLTHADNFSSLASAQVATRKVILSDWLINQYADRKVSEIQMAYAIAHEIAHIIKGHTIDGEQQEIEASTLGADILLKAGYQKEEIRKKVVPFIAKKIPQFKKKVTPKGASSFSRERVEVRNGQFYAAIADAVNRHIDQAMSARGGIDFTAAKTPLEIQNGGEGIKFKIDPAMLQKLQNAPGFVPVVINIQPLTDLRIFLGLPL